MPQKIKRFYKKSDVIIEEKSYAVALDSRPVRTPAKAPLSLSSKELALAIAAEWNAQGEEVDPATMPMMTLACTALDYVGPNRKKVEEDVASYAAYDMVCYWTEDQEVLAARQIEHWQPLLDWAAAEFGAELVRTSGVVAAEQPAEAVTALREPITAMDDFELMALATATQAAGSLIIGLALFRGRIDPVEAFTSAQLDETYQIELWGEDQEAAIRRAAIAAEFQSASRFLNLLQA